MKETVYEKSMSLNPRPMRVNDNTYDYSRFSNSAFKDKMSKMYSDAMRSD